MPEQQLSGLVFDNTSPWVPDSGRIDGNVEVQLVWNDSGKPAMVIVTVLIDGQVVMASDAVALMPSRSTPEFTFSKSGLAAGVHTVTFDVRDTSGVYASISRTVSVTVR